MKNLFIFLICAAFLTASTVIDAKNSRDVQNSPVNLTGQVAAKDEIVENYKKILSEEAHKVLEEKDTALPYDSEQMLNKMIEDAAKRLKRDKANEKTLTRAKANVRKFTLAIVKNSPRRRTPRGEVERGGKPTSFYERQVNAKAVKAAKGICPLYPICN